MSQENVDAVHQYIDALNRRDVESLLQVCDPEIDFRSLFSDVLGGTFHRHAGMREYFREWTDTFEEAQIEIDAIEDRGDLVVTRLRAHGRARASGADVAWQVVSAARIRDGRVLDVAACRSEPEALEAVGLRE